MNSNITKFFQALHYWPAYLLLKIVYGFRIEGHENLKGLENGPIIFVSNHRSLFDGPICAVSLPRNYFYPADFFPIRFLAAREINYDWKNRFPFPLSVIIAGFVRLSGSIPVIRGQGAEANLSEAIKAINEENAKIWIYPEGKMSKDGVFQKKGKRGVYYLQKMTGASVVPVGIKDNHKLLTPSFIWKFILGKKRIQLQFGKPIYNLGDNEEKGIERVMEEIEKLI